MRLPIGTGTGFLTSQELVRGFKVHVSAVDPLAVPLVAQTIDIETAAFAGHISNANSTGFTYTLAVCQRQRRLLADARLHRGHTANGYDDMRQSRSWVEVVGFHLPDTDVTFGTDAIADFVADHQWLGELRRHRRCAERRGVRARRCWGDGATNPSGWSPARRRADADARAARHRNHGLSLATALQRHARERHAAGHGGCQHHDGLSDARLPAGPQRTVSITMCPIDITIGQRSCGHHQPG